MATPGTKACDAVGGALRPQWRERPSLLLLSLKVKTVVALLLTTSRRRVFFILILRRK